ncbi:MAG: hemin uptake protein HemP [Pseudomonadota bacterium]
MSDRKASLDSATELKLSATERYATEPEVINSSTLFGSATIVRIRHRDEVYTLRVTRADKLLLTK